MLFFDTERWLCDPSSTFLASSHLRFCIYKMRVITDDAVVIHPHRLGPPGIRTSLGDHSTYFIRVPQWAHGAAQLKMSLCFAVPEILLKLRNVAQPRAGAIQKCRGVNAPGRTVMWRRMRVHWSFSIFRWYNSEMHSMQLRGVLSGTDSQWVAHNGNELINIPLIGVNVCRPKTSGPYPKSSKMRSMSCCNRRRQMMSSQLYERLRDLGKLFFFFL